MKKAIAMFLCLAFLAIAGANQSKTAKALENQRPTPTYASEQSPIIQNRYAPTKDEDGLITIEYIKSLSWEEISNNYEKLFNNGDDLYLRNIVKYIGREEFDFRKENLVSHNGQVYLKNTDYKTMCEKIQIIVDAYNISNEIQIAVYTRLYDDEPGHMEINILSSNCPATYVGEEVEIKWGAIFYESSKNWGSGNWNTTFCIDYESYGFGTPSFIPEDYIVVINGVSYLDENGNIVSSYYEPYDSIKTNNIKIPIDRSKPYMLHTCTSQRDLGWGAPETVKSIS